MHSMILGGPFKLQVLLDEASLLACAVYVDLNPIRAAIAEIPESREYTGAKDRIDDLDEHDDHARLPPKKINDRERKLGYFCDISLRWM